MAGSAWSLHHWHGPYRGHADWHWVHLTYGRFHKHGYGCSFEEAQRNAYAAVPTTSDEYVVPAGFQRRI